MGFAIEKRTDCDYIVSQTIEHLFLLYTLCIYFYQPLGNIAYLFSYNEPGTRSLPAKPLHFMAIYIMNCMCPKHYEN